MSNLKYLLNSPVHNYVGENIFSKSAPDSTWILGDTVLSQAAYPYLFNKIGLIPDGFRNWNIISRGVTFLRIIYGGELFVGAGVSGVLATSTDAITWTARTSGTTSTIRALIYANGIYVYAGDGGVLATSTNGITWTARTSGTTTFIYSLTYGDGIYVYAGSGALATSTDAITWTARATGQILNRTINSVIYGDGLYVYGSLLGVVGTSTNGITWTARQTQFDRSIESLAYGNGLYVLSGEDGLIATSTDAITWTKRQPNPPNSSNLRVRYFDGEFICFGTSTNIVTSTDGINWVRRSTDIGATFNINALIYANNKYYLSSQQNFIAEASKYTYNTATEFVLPRPLRISQAYQLDPTIFVKGA